jgi:hypothetical protein
VNSEFVNQNRSKEVMRISFLMRNQGVDHICLTASLPARLLMKNPGLSQIRFIGRPPALLVMRNREW